MHSTMSEDAGAKQKDSALQDEEKRLKAKLERRASGEREQRLKEKLKAKLERRAGGETSPGKEASPEDGGVRKDPGPGSKKEGSPKNGEQRRSRSAGSGKHPRRDDSGWRSGPPHRRRRRRRSGSHGPSPRGGGPYRGPPRGGGGGGGRGRGYGGPPGPYYGGPPPGWRGRGPPPPGRYPVYDVDDFGRRRPSHPRSRSRSRSARDDDSYFGRSYSRSPRSRSRSRSRSGSRHRRRGRSRSRSYSSPSSSSSSGSSRSRSRSSSMSSQRSRGSRSSASSASSRSAPGQEDTYTKDQRTVFVTQLVMRTTERELYKFFRSKGLKTNDITFLRDRRTGKHKGSAYVELRKMEHVATAIGLSGQRPDFQRFPVLIKASEAEKNYVAAPATVPATVPLTLTTTGPVLQQDGTYVQSQKVYVGNLDPAVTQEHLFALFSPFGQLEQVALQTQNGVSKGFAFLQYTDPKSSNLAIQTLQGQMLAGRPLKTGWASQGGGSGVQVVTSTEFPADAVARTQKAYGVLAQLASGQAIVANVAGAATVPSPTAATVSPTARTVVSRIPTVAEARASLAAGTAPSPMAAALSAQQAIPPPPLATSTSSAAAVSPDPKDEETDPGWELEIAEEFEEECSKFGKILRLTVMHEEAGGRWFDKRQLRVEYVLEQNLPADHKQKLQVSYERRNREHVEKFDLKKQ